MTDNFDLADWIEPRPGKLSKAEWLIVYLVIVPAAIFLFVFDCARGKMKR